MDAALKTTQEVQQAKEEEIPQSVFGADTGIVTTQEEIDYAVECAVKHYGLLKKFVRR